MNEETMLPAAPLRGFLDRHMARHDLSRGDLAEQVGVDRRTLDRLYDDAGDGGPPQLVSLRRADRILAGLDCHLSDVWPRRQWEPEPFYPRTKGPGSLRELRRRLVS